MKAITIAGRIGKDAVVRTTQGGDKVTGWTVAVDEGWGDNKRTLWFECSWWGQRGERVSEYLTQGINVTVSGEFSTREHEGRTYLRLRVNDLTFQGGGQREDSGRQDQRGYDREADPKRKVDLDDDIPF